MKTIINCFFIILISIGIINCDCDDTEPIISDAMKEHGVVTDVIDVAPEHLLKVSFCGVKVLAGNELTPTQVKDIPNVKWHGDADSFYTLIMTDPDAPSRANPESREFLHWMIVNIPGSKVADGETIYEYVGSGPPSGTGLHRYIFLIYKQPSKLTFDEPKVSNHSAVNRRLFSTRNFAAKYHLGNSIFGNFYQAQYDDYVPTVHKQLGLA